MDAKVSLLRDEAIKQDSKVGSMAAKARKVGSKVNLWFLLPATFAATIRGPERTPCRSQPGFRC